MEIDLVTEALKFMLLGMGTVFVFLILMIIAMNILRGFVNRCFPEDTSGPSVGGAASTASTNIASSKKNKIAAIIGAICQHKQAK